MASTAPEAPVSGPPPQSQITPPAPIGATVRRVGAYLAALAGLALALHELSVLSGGFLTTAGEHAMLNDLGGTGVWGQRGGWHQILSGAQVDAWFRLLVMYVVLDGVFVAVYATGLWRLVGRLDSGLDVRHFLRVLWWTLVVAEAVEGVGQLAIGVERCGGKDCVSDLLVIGVSLVTTVKWIAVALFALAGLAALSILSARDWPAARVRARQVCSALWIQRFSLLLFVPVAILAVVPADELNNAFGQLPDIQRAWLDDWTGIWYAVAAGAVHGLVVIMVFVLGRIRSDFAVQRAAGGTNWPYFDPKTDGTPGTARPAGRGLWLVAPGVLIPLALLVEWRDDGAVNWWRLGVFCAVPLAVLGLSRLARNAAMPRLPERGGTWPHDVMAVGDILAVTAAAVSGLGLIRALTPVVALRAAGLLDDDFVIPPAIPLVLGAVLLVGAWPASYRILRRVHSSGLALGAAPASAPTAAGRVGRLRAAVSRTWRQLISTITPGTGIADSDADSTRRRDGFKLGILAVAIFFFIWLCARPRFFAYTFGALAVTIAALATLGIMLGATVAYAQDRQPTQIFAWIRIFRRRGDDDKHHWEGFRASPFILLMCLTLLGAGFIGRTFVHPVPSGTAALPPRPTLDEAFDAWERQTVRCTRPYAPEATAGGAGLRLRPMLMYAAEGGGIRASYWTAAALQTVATGGTASLDHERGLQRHGGDLACGARAALFSAGASGGALGLTLGRWDNRPLDVAEAMTDQAALGVASIALVAGDLLATGTGIRFGAPAPGRSPDPARLDRAGLMETAWEREGRFDRLRGTSYLPDDIAEATTRTEGTVTGQLILGSTSARDGCRALLSQVDLGAGAPEDTESWPTCPDGNRSDPGPGPATGPDAFDVFAEFGRTTDDDVTSSEDDHCLGNPPALTVGLLASRFPYITPSGVVGECNEHDPTQLIDGGYADNTGLGVILNLAPGWAEKVRRYNDRVLDAGSGDLIVPMVVFLDNGAGGDYTFADQPVPIVEAQDEQHRYWPRSWGIPELLVPPIGILHAASHKVGIRKELKAAGAAAHEALCSSDSPTCSELKSSDQLGPQVIVVHQGAQPSIPAPLGWVLSEASEDDLLSDMSTQAEKASADLPMDGATRAGYGSLRDLLDALVPPAGQ